MAFSRLSRRMPRELARLDLSYGRRIEEQNGSEIQDGYFEGSNRVSDWIWAGRGMVLITTQATRGQHIADHKSLDGELETW